MENDTVYLNGAYLPLSEARISVLDRGFLFGDGVYEVIPAYQGRLFHWPEHGLRLEHSLAGIRLANPYSREQWQAIFAPWLSSGRDQYLYLQITRGAAAKRDHAFPENTPPTVFVMCQDIVPFAGKDTGVSAVTLTDSRWHSCNLKTIALLANILHRQAALDQGSAEAILLKDGYVTEGAASNVFAVIRGELRTPPKSHEILPGITRDVIVMLAGQNQVVCQETPITLAELHSAEEIWLTSSTREIIPVIELDDLPVGDGKPGALYRKMDGLFQAYKHAFA